MTSSLEDYALIGDGKTAALVNRNGSIDWLCWPRFDDDACFCALLGNEENGRWLLCPTISVLSTSRTYQTDTLVVETVMHTVQGAVRLIDFMPVGQQHSSVVRIVEGLSGVVPMELDLRLRFDYGAVPPWCEVRGGTLVAEVGPDRVTLSSPVPLAAADDVVSCSFEVKAGQNLAFCLVHALVDNAVTQPPNAPDAHVALAATQKYWRGWISRFDESKTRWPAAVKRSLLTLRAMIYGSTGGLMAAPTSSLPEAPGGAMNWDYRYCWLRDATFTLGAFVNAGFHEEATRWRDWLLRAVAGSPEKMRIMYRGDGSRHLNEWIVQSLPGYRGARPVRVGNAASTQHQVDVLGEVLDCLNFARRAGISVTAQQTEVQRRIVDHLAAHWRDAGSGIWESRGEPRQYTYSKAMAWAGIRCALEDDTVEGSGPQGRRRRLEFLLREIHDDVCREGWNAGLGTFTQSYGTQVIDASLLLMPIVGFLPANDPRMAATIETVRAELSEGGLIRRMRATPDGSNEGAFLACSCWMADCLQMQGRHEEAVAQFERVLEVANDVGLLSEEFNVPGKHLSGNFPQALTHLAVVNTALGLSGHVINRGGG